MSAAAEPVTTPAIPQDGVFEIPIRIYYEDTDLAGIVYYANYLKFFERARTEFLRAVGIEQSALKAREGFVFAVRRVEIDYLTPARFDDLLHVSAEIDRLGGASLTMRQQVRRGEEILARGAVKIACLSDTGRPVRLPATVRTAFEGRNTD